MAGETSKKRIAVLFGGQSVEHEISIITGLQVLDNLDAELYEAIPVYITQDGRWYTSPALAVRSNYESQDALRATLAAATEVTLLPCHGEPGLVILTKPGKQRALPWTRSRLQHVPVDAYILALHGSHGEDGCIQGLMDLAGAAYTGCNLLASAIGMNKRISKLLARVAGIQVLPELFITKAEAIADLPGVIKRVENSQELGSGPWMVKPCSLGSSVGIGAADDSVQLGTAITSALQFDDSILVEPRITNLREINVSVRDGAEVSAAIIEVPSTGGVLTYEMKYMSGGKAKAQQSEGMASMQRRYDPADVPPEVKQRAQEMAVKLYRFMGCSGVARIDLIQDQSTGELYFNEINTLPGSLSYYTWQRSQPSVLFPELINTMIDTALERHASRSTLKRDFGFRALSKQTD